MLLIIEKDAQGMECTGEEAANFLNRGLYAAAMWISALLPKKDLLVAPDTCTISDIEIKALFQTKNYLQCYELFRLSGSALPEIQFLSHYALFLAIMRPRYNSLLDDQEDSEAEARKQAKEKEETFERLQELQTNIFLFKKDSYFLYLSAKIEQCLGRPKMALIYAQQSLKKNPYNWECWLVLLAETADPADLEKNQVTISPIMVKFFLVQSYLHFEIFPLKTEQLLNELEHLLGPNRRIQEQRALLYYQRRDFKAAKDIYKTLQEEKPGSVDNYDILANILFIEGKIHELAVLGLQAEKIDPYRPETCIVLGNYHALHGSHEEAILFFRKALKLDPNSHAIWTLIGHEYIELSNLSASILCYQRALSQNNLDYKAWYGLGQAYEILHKPTQAIYYYKRAYFIKKDLRIEKAIIECQKML